MSPSKLAIPFKVKRSPTPPRDVVTSHPQIHCRHRTNTNRAKFSHRSSHLLLTRFTLSSQIRQTVCAKELSSSSSIQLYHQSALLNNPPRRPLKSHWSHSSPDCTFGWKDRKRGTMLILRSSSKFVVKGKPFPWQPNPFAIHNK